MPILKTFNKGKVPVHVWTDEIESPAIDQLVNLSNLPIIAGHVAAMPDVHAGRGSTIGSVIPTKGAIIPSAVGVDIGCGMNALRLSLKADQLPEDLYKLRVTIEKAIPIGFATHAWDKVQGSQLARNARKLDDRLDHIVGKHPGLMKMQRSFARTWVMQLGTLGTGNHFIELCLDEEGSVWIMLHSGSRGTGNVIGRYFMAQAQKFMRSEGIQIMDKDLSYFVEDTALFDDYLEAVEWAQDYAMLNRSEMMRLVVDALKPILPSFKLTDEEINCHHNYVAEETHFGEKVYITRKGAISAKAGELGIVPGSMGAKSYIVRGLGNELSYHSCAHGAGRKMSRTKAKQRFSEFDLMDQTAGIECRKDKGIVDEIPGAYKDIVQVMENQQDLVEVAHTLKQVLCIKG